MPDANALRALERLRFAGGRTLNLRTGLPTGDEAALRVDRWLRTKQVELSGDVLIITGRGASSLGGVPVIRESTRRVLNRLRRAGVVASYGENTPGSFVVTLAPLRDLLQAPRRRGARHTDPGAAVHADVAGAIDGLKSETLAGLRALALRAIEALGVRQPTADMVNAEMQRQFTLLASSAPGSGDPDRWLADAIARARREFEDSLA
ncbi:MAG: Smr/MutS family protein [Gemmatimonadaceae bacterium]|nr:Smr/MutS family protein [Gemmatimonadaceae bacterium]